MFTRRTNIPKLDILLLHPVGKWVGSDTSGENGITHLHAFADSLSLKDVYRVKNPSELLFTWFTGPHSVACHLDRFIPRARGDYKCVTIHISSVCKNTIGAFKSPGARRLEIVITTASLPQTLGSASGPLSKGNFETSQADSNNADNCHRLLEIKDQLRDDAAIEGCILRKEQWTELLEKPTRYTHASHATRSTNYA